MSLDTLGEQIRAAQARLAALRARAGSEAPAASRADGTVPTEELAELSRVLEELHVGAEAAAEESPERLRRVLDATSDGIWDWPDLSAPRMWWSSQFRALLGYAPSDLDASLEVFMDLLHPDDRERIRQELGERFKAAGTFESEYRLRAQSGEYRWFSARGRTYYDAQGHPVRMVGSIRDISARKCAEAALAESESRYRELFENSGTGIAIVDAAGVYQMVNRIAADKFGKPPEEIVGKSMSDLLPADTAGKYLEANRALIATGGRREHEDSFALAGGERAFLIVDRCLQDAQGNAVGIQSSSIDITERKWAEERVRREALRAEALLRIAARLNARLDLGAVLHTVTEEAARALHMPAALVTLCDAGRGEFALAATYGLPPGFAAGYRSPARQAYERLAPAGERVVVVGDVQRMPELLNYALLVEHNIRTAIGVTLRRQDELVGMLTLFSLGELRELDEDERRLLEGLADQAAQAVANARLHAQVDQQRAGLRALAARLEETEQAERKRLARELHDQVAQNLSAIGVDLHIVRGQITEAGASFVRERVDEALALVDETTAQVRGLMAELRPAVLDDYGLLAALRWYGARFSARTGLAVAVRGEEPSPRLAAAVENALFYIAQEALTNVARHAHATRVLLTQDVTPARVRLTIADDGIGLAAAQQGQTRLEPGWGLLIMLERAEAVDGACRVEPGPGGGTQVVVEAPR